MSLILLIDDQPIANFISRKVLQIAGFEENVKDYTNPVEAFEVLQKEKNALLFLDLNMPEMTGWEFLDKMKTYNLTNKTFILTSSTSELDRQKAKDYPWVIAYLVKPLNKQTATEISSILKNPDYSFSK